MIGGDRREQEIGRFAIFRHGLMHKLCAPSTNRSSMKDFTGMQLQRTPGPGLAPLQDGLGAGDEPVHRRKTGGDIGQLHRLLDAAENLKLAFAPAQQAAIGIKAGIGSQLNGLADNLRAAREFASATRAVFRYRPASSSFAGPGSLTSQ